MLLTYCAVSLSGENNWGNQELFQMVECVAWDDVVLGSSPRFLSYVESSSDGRTPDCDSGCRGFESRLSPHIISFGDVKCMPLFKGVVILRDGRPGVIPGRRHLIPWK